MARTANESERIRVCIDPDLEELIPMYLDTRRRDVTLIAQALERGDWRALEAIGHCIKGSGGGYGFPVISEIGEALEKAAVRHDAETMCREGCRLEDYLERLEVVYED